MPKGKCTTFAAFFEAVQAVKGNPDRYRNLTVQDVAAKLSEDIGEYVAGSTVGNIFLKAGVERTNMRNKQSLKAQQVVARGVIRTFLNMGALAHEIDEELASMAGWEHSELIDEAAKASAAGIAMTALVSASDHH